MSVDIIYEANVVMVIDAGIILSFEFSFFLLLYFCLRFDHIRPKPQLPVSSTEPTTTTTNALVNNKPEPLIKIANEGNIISVILN